MTSGHALVVGATSEIGAAISQRLVDNSYFVTGWGRSRTRLAGLAERSAHRVRTDVVDVRDDAAVVRALQRLDETSVGPLRVVVYAVGLFDWAPADEADPETWGDLIDTNLTAAARLTPRVLTRLRRSTPSTLVYVGSGAAHRIFPNNAAYVASKHGLAALAAATFLDVKRHGVRVSLVSPGLVAAGGGLASREGQERPEELLQPEDVADCVDFVVRFPGRGCPVVIDLQPLI